MIDTPPKGWKPSTVILLGYDQYYVDGAWVQRVTEVVGPFVTANDADMWLRSGCDLVRRAKNAKLEWKKRTMKNPDTERAIR